MGLVLSSPPGYTDLQDSILVADNPALGIELAEIYSNAAFGKSRCEIFQDHYKDGDTVPLPVSETDGYQYSRSECTFIWAVESSANKDSGWKSGEDSLWFCAWLVDQSTGLVSCEEWYRRSGSHYDPVKTNDGTLRVFTIAQRIKNDLVMATSPTYSAISAGWIGLDKPFSQQLAQGLNGNAKFSVVNEEVIYLGEYYDGQTVTLPISPADGYHYTAPECRFQFSWRWTGLGNSLKLVAPPVSYGQMATMKASVNGSGVVSVSVAYIEDDNLTTYTTQGRIAVFALCTRSATPAGITLTGFQEIDYDNFMPGSPLSFDKIVAVVNEDINEALGTPEFFGPTVYKDGDIIPLPVSVFDPTYTYQRSELHYIYEISDTTNQTGSHLRVPIWYTDILETTGHVKVNVWRLPPGGPDIDDNNTLGRVTVTVMARRQQAVAATGITAVDSNPSGSSAAGVGTQDIPTLSAVKQDVFSGDGSTTVFTLSASPVGGLVMVFWAGAIVLPTDYSISGNSLTTNFKDAGGNSTPAPSGDKIYVVYFS